MWWLIWIVLLVGSAVLLGWLAWRLFISVKNLLVEIGDTTASATRTGDVATKRFQGWVETRQVADDEYLERLNESARPRPAGFAPVGPYDEQA